jgi:peptidoglycan/xylan/chitin deacetylase (PgdA/CDA1 family)
MSSKPIASLSLDLDDLWAYQRSHGDPEWERRKSYLPALMPPLLDLLDEHACRITFFVVGVDAADPKNIPWLRMITARGHEVGNHSFNHECWMQRGSHDEILTEIRRAEEAITAATGERPLGYRGPAFSWSPTLLDVLAERGYLYDASTLPTFLGPIARAYFLAAARLSAEQRQQHRDLFGSFRDGFRPVHVYRWRLPSGRPLLEIPVTTMPIVKTPFHMSYMLYLSRFSLGLMRAYLRLALQLCLRTGVNPSFLMHPLDFLGLEHAPEVAFFPGMDLPLAHKQAVVHEVMTTLAAHFRLVPMSSHAANALAHERLAVLEPGPRRLGNRVAADRRVPDA